MAQVAAQFLSHERHAHIRYAPDAKENQHKKRVYAAFESDVPSDWHTKKAKRKVNKPGSFRTYEGLTRALKRTLWADYVFPTRNLPRGTPVQVSDGLDGIERGKLVHAEIELYVKSGSEEVWRERLQRKPHDATVMILKAIHKCELRVVASELPIFDEELGVATAIDVVCMDRNDQLVVVEIKTGYDRTFKVATGSKKMRNLGKNVHVSNCQYSQHQCQLAMMMLMLRKRYGVETSGVVFHYRGNVVYNYPLDPTFGMIAENVYAAVRRRKALGGRK